MKRIKVANKYLVCHGAVNGNLNLFIFNDRVSFGNVNDFGCQSMYSGNQNAAK